MDKIESLKAVHTHYESIRKEISRIIIGQEAVLESLLIAFFSNGHAQLVGVPGLAKTMMIQSLADVMDLRFRRIQFTPDLMPSDITGTEIIEEDMQTGRRSFRFIQGPLFGNIILADEINRTPPKTQAALLEAMQERQITAAGNTYKLEAPFFVLATQNPIEQEGTYPLPEAQLDRFMFQLPVDYPSAEEEKEIVVRTTSAQTIQLQKVIGRETLLEIQQIVKALPVAEHIVDFGVNLVRATRPEDSNIKAVHDYVRWGAGPRASQYLIIAAKTRAALHGKVTPDEEDIKAVSTQVLRHRILRNFKAEADGVSVDDLIGELIRA
ncbi:MAG: MoxR family ATPase [Candidatus Marinimicrobia bacterium]|jgi:MoxR-like ATPase|nr:MoxR family ATPase [Candidatus Neomarinimicrobiota bacterium]MDD5710371.1 MoxR family ATPase [Candidatus Neomarinimicrobiota bacterium]